jgi:hypothetical protein
VARTFRWNPYLRRCFEMRDVEAGGGEVYECTRAESAAVEVESRRGVHGAELFDTVSALWDG